MINQQELWLHNNPLEVLEPQEPMIRLEDLWIFLDGYLHAPSNAPIWKYMIGPILLWRN